MSWIKASQPTPQLYPLHRVEVSEAYVTASGRGDLFAQPSKHVPRRWMTGGVYRPDGSLVQESIRTWVGDRAAPVAVDPLVARAPRAASTLNGRWLYGGNWTSHFGHFLVEVLPMLWGPRAQYDGMLFHATPRGSVIRPGAFRTPELTKWQRELIRLAGYAELQPRVVLRRGVRVESLTVPSRPVILKAWAAEEAVQVWQEVSDRVQLRGSAKWVFLSRSKFNARLGATDRKQIRTESTWDARLDRVFASAGFQVLHPETLALRDQIEIVRGAEVLAGASGSALHLSVFAKRGIRVLEVGDRRSGGRALPTQRMVDGACGNWTQFVDYGDVRGLEAALRSVG